MKPRSSPPAAPPDPDSQPAPRSDAQPLPQDAQSLSQSPQPLQQDAHSLPQDSQSLPQDSHSLPQDSQSLPQDAQSLPQDAQSLSQGWQSLPQDSQALPQGAPAPPAAPPSRGPRLWLLLTTLLLRPTLRRPLLLIASLVGVAAGTAILCALNLANERALRSFEVSAAGLPGEEATSTPQMQLRSPRGRIPVTQLDLCLAWLPHGVHCRGVLRDTLRVLPAQAPSNTNAAAVEEILLIGGNAQLTEDAGKVRIAATTLTADFRLREGVDMQIEHPLVTVAAGARGVGERLHLLSTGGAAGPRLQAQAGA